jgi:hypothetical protein
VNAATRAILTEFCATAEAYLKNCGTGAGGFQSGNHCGNSAAGAKRRQAAGRRRREGPDSGIGPQSRAAIRRRRGRHRASQRQHVQHANSPGASHADRELHADHSKERRELAQTLRGERRDLRESAHADRRSLAREIRGERKEGRKDRAKDRGDLGKQQTREAAKLERAHGKQREKLDAKHRAERDASKAPDTLEARHARQREALAGRHRDEASELAGTHKQERRDLREQQRGDREYERENHRERIQDDKDSERRSRNDLHLDHREQIHELRGRHRQERADQMRSDLEDRRDELGSKSLSAPEDAIPSADAILARALDATGHAEAWEAGTLDGRRHLDVLHAVRMEARRILRAEAAAVLVELAEHGEKALFGAARAAVGRFFERAGKIVREAIVAGVLAVAGPGPAVLDHPVVQEAIEAQVSDQMGYLDAFRTQILDEARPIDGTFVARAEMYGGAPWATTQTIQRTVAKRSGIFNFEAREHFGVDPNDLCRDCREEIARGIVPIGTLKVIGASACKTACHCAFKFFETEDGPEYTTIFAGRGPMDFGVFGQTG